MTKKRNKTFEMRKSYLRNNPFDFNIDYSILKENKYCIEYTIKQKDNIISAKTLSFDEHELYWYLPNELVNKIIKICIFNIKEYIYKYENKEA